MDPSRSRERQPGCSRQLVCEAWVHRGCGSAAELTQVSLSGLSSWRKNAGDQLLHVAALMFKADGGGENSGAGLGTEEAGKCHPESVKLAVPVPLLRLTREADPWSWRRCS